MTDLREKVRQLMSDAVLSSAPDAEERATDAIMALVQPVVTRDDVIEELADLAEHEALSIFDHDESVADWLRSRKGGA